MGNRNQLLDPNTYQAPARKQPMPDSPRERARRIRAVEMYQGNVPIDRIAELLLIGAEPDPKGLDERRKNAILRVKEYLGLC